MALHLSPTAVATRGPLAQRRTAIRREALRDFAAIAVGVVVSALIWLACQALTRL